MNFNISVETLQNMQMGMAIHNHNTLMFVIKLPTESVALKKALIVPIPNENFHQIDAEREYVLRANNSIFTYTGEKTFKSLQTSRNCVFKGRCNLIPFKAETVELIEEGTIIVINANNTPMVTSCDDRRLNLTGNYLFSFFNCTVRIRNYDFISQLMEGTQKFLLTGSNPSLTTVLNPTLEKIHIEQIHNIKTIEEIKFHQDTSTRITYSTIAAIGIAVILLTIIILYQRRQGIRVKISNELPQRSTELNNIVSHHLPT